jgi:phosphoglycolate phosphatase
MSYRLVIFDFDGTLADTFPWFSRVLNGVADRFGFKRIEDGEGETLRGLSAQEIIAHLGVPRWKLPLIARHMRKLAAEHRDEIRLFAGVDRMLQGLAERGIWLAVVSSNSEANVRRTLGPENEVLINDYACGASLFGKAAKFRRVLKRSRVLPFEAICIGDEIRDAEAARTVGIAFGAVAWGFTELQALRAHRPDMIFASLGDVSMHLTANGGRRSTTTAESNRAP